MDARTAYGKCEAPQFRSSLTQKCRSSRPTEDCKMIIVEIVWNEIFDESSDGSFNGFDEVEVGLSRII